MFLRLVSKVSFDKNLYIVCLENGNKEYQYIFFNKKKVIKKKSFIFLVMTASRLVGGAGTPLSRPPPSRDKGRAVVTPPSPPPNTQTSQINITKIGEQKIREAKQKCVTEIKNNSKNGSSDKKFKMAIIFSCVNKSFLNYVYTSSINQSRFYLKCREKHYYLR